MKIYGDIGSGNCLKVKWTADIALLAYTCLAHEGGFDLSGRPNLRAWIARCESALGAC
jgi:glutathione S-transferase